MIKTMKYNFISNTHSSNKKNYFDIPASAIQLPDEIIKSSFFNKHSLKFYPINYTYLL